MKEYANDWIYSTLINLGLRPKDHGDSWRFAATFRGGTNQSAVVLFKKSGIWTDYGEGGDEYYPFELLIKKIAGADAASQIIGNAALGDSEIRKTTTLLKMSKVHDPSCLKRLIPHKQFFTKRGINAIVLDKMQSGYSAGGTGFYQRYVFPLFNEYSQIVGFAGRHVFWKEEMTNVPKWKIIGPKNDIVWPLYVPTFPECEKKILESRSVLLVESIGDSLALTESGYENNIVLFGLALQNKIITELIRLDPEKISICLNNDEEENGQIAACKVALKLLKHFSISKLEIKIPTKNDIGVMLCWGEDIKSWVNQDGITGSNLVQFIKKYEDRLPKKYNGLIKKYA